MKITIELELKNVFEEHEFKVWLKNHFNLLVKNRYKLKKLKIEIT